MPTTATFVLRMEIKVVTNIARPHQVEPKSIHLQATLIQMNDKKYLVFPTYMWEKKSSEETCPLYLITEDGVEIALDSNHIHYSKVLNLAYLDVANVSDANLQSIFQLMKGLPLVKLAPESGIELLARSFEYKEAYSKNLTIKKASGGVAAQCFSWYDPKLPLKRVAQSTRYLHSRATVTLYSGNMVPADKIAAFTNRTLRGAPVVVASETGEALVGLMQGWEYRDQLIMSARVIQLFIDYQTRSDREIEFVSLPVEGYIFHKGQDAGNFFSSTGILVTDSDHHCGIKQGEFITAVDGHSFNKRGLQINDQWVALQEYLLEKAVEENYKVTLEVLNSDRVVRDQTVDLYRSLESPFRLLKTIPVGELPYLIIGPLVLSYVYIQPYKDSPKLENSFEDKQLIHIAYVLASEKNYQKYQGFIIDTVGYKDGDQYGEQAVINLD
nr:hypothetical protein [Legionellales bacterium]